VICQFGVADHGVLSFHWLFAEVLGGSGPSSGLGVSSGMNGINGVGGTIGYGAAVEASMYPLIEATVEFLREFVVEIVK